MLENDYPILEFDEENEPFLKPSDSVGSVRIAERCVLCFFSEAIQKVLDSRPYKEYSKLRCEGFPIPIFEVDYNGTTVVLVQAAVGAPLAATQIEELSAMGVTKFICCGSCGVLEKELNAGNIIIPTAAIRDEGTSYHYAPPSREAYADEDVVKILEETLTEANIPFVKGKTWTTDAIYRETPEKIKRRREEGCIVVDMEASTYMVVSQFKGVKLGQFLYAGDNLSGDEWDYRGYLENYEIRDLLLQLSIDAVLKL